MKKEYIKAGIQTLLTLVVIALLVTIFVKFPITVLLLAAFCWVAWVIKIIFLFFLEETR